MDYKIVSNISELGDFQKDLGLTKLISLDTETTGLDTIVEEMVLLQLKLNNNIYIFNCRSLGLRYATYIIDLIKASEKTCVVQNAKYDLEVIKTNTDILLENIYDLFVTEVLITNGLGTRFPPLVKMVLKYEGVVLKKEVRLDFTDPNLVLEKKHYDYAAKDIIYLESIRKKQLEEIERSGQQQVHELEMKFLPVLAQMKLNGVFLNIDKWHIIEENYKKKAK